MSRVWKEVPSPKMLQKVANIYRGQWMPQMDRCWASDDGFEVMSRLLITDWGKVEHATIIAVSKEMMFSSDGSRDIPWSLKQEIKNEVFGENRLAIEVFPKTSNLVDVCDVYHLWVFPKDFNLPFGIHPTKDKQCKSVNRGVPSDANQLVNNFQWIQQILQNKF